MKYGLERRCARVRACEVPVLALDDPASGARDKALGGDRARQGRGRRRGDRARLRRHGRTRRRARAPHTGCRSIDGVAAAVKLAEALVGARPRDLEARPLCAAAAEAVHGGVRGAVFRPGGRWRQRGFDSRRGGARRNFRRVTESPPTTFYSSPSRDIRMARSIRFAENLLNAARRLPFRPSRRLAARGRARRQRRHHFHRQPDRRRRRRRGAGRAAILTAAVAGWAAGAMAMAAGEYVSVSSQADSEAADLERERRALENFPEIETTELTRRSINGAALRRRWRARSPNS